MSQPAARTATGRWIAAAAALAAAVILGGVWATGARAAWYCEGYDDPYGPRDGKPCTLPRDPNGSGYLMAHLWNPELAPPPPVALAVSNRGGHEVKVQNWRFGILVEETKIAPGHGRRVGLLLGDRVWGAGTTGSSTVRMFYDVG